MPRNKKPLLKEDELSLSTIVEEQVENCDDEVELISDVDVIEELSDEAKQRQERALLSVREQAMAVIDKNKLRMAKSELDGVEMASEIMNDPEVLETVKGNVKSAMDLKFLAEFQKIKLQNLQTLLRMDSVNTEGNAGEVFVGVEFGNSNGTTKIVVNKR